MHVENSFSNEWFCTLAFVQKGGKEKLGNGLFTLCLIGFLHLVITVIQSPPPHGQGPVPPLQSPGGSRNQGMRQMGDVEGVRLVHGNVPVIQDVSDADISAWKNRRIVPNRKPSIAK